MYLTPCMGVHEIIILKLENKCEIYCMNNQSVIQKT